MKKVKDIAMMILCGILLSVTFLVFAFLCIFSSTARWIIEEAMNRVADVISQGESRRIERIRGSNKAIAEE